MSKSTQPTVTYAQGAGNRSEQICVTTFHERVPFRCPTPVQTCTKNNVHLLRLLPCYHEYGWKFIFHCEYEWIGWVVVYPGHGWFWFCRCFPKFLTHFFDKKCWSTRLNLGVRHQKRRNSGKDVLGYDRGVGQSDALTYSHPIDHSNDRYRERFFSFRNGFGPKIPVERPKSTIFWPTKEQGSTHARTATIFSTSQPQMVHHQHATRHTRPNIRLKGYAANQSPRPTPPPVISPSLTITISCSKALCGWNVSWCSKHCSPMVGRCGCWFLPKHHGEKCRPTCVQWWGGGGPVEFLVVLDRGRTTWLWILSDSDDLVWFPGFIF